MRLFFVCHTEHNSSNGELCWDRWEEERKSRKRTRARFVEESEVAAGEIGLPY